MNNVVQDTTLFLASLLATPSIYSHERELLNNDWASFSEASRLLSISAEVAPATGSVCTQLA